MMILLTWSLHPLMKQAVCNFSLQGRNKKRDHPTADPTIIGDVINQPVSQYRSTARLTLARPLSVVLLQRHISRVRSWVNPSLMAAIEPSVSA